MSTIDNKEFFFENYKGKFIPIIDWEFFDSLERAKEIYNHDTFQGWDDDWQAIASNGHGDPVFFKEGSIYTIGHDTGFNKSLITKCLESLDKLFQLILSSAELSDAYINRNERDILNKKKKLVSEAKKIAPENLKYDFEIEINNINSAIEDLEYSETPEGKFRQHGLETIHIAFNKLQESGKYSDLILGYKFEEKKYVVFYSLNADESLEEIQSTINAFLPSYPVEYIEDA